MKIVIDIPEEVVIAIQNGKDYRYDIHTSIAQGIPLPNGHGRLIDADAYISEINRIFPCKDRDDKNIRRATEIGMTNAPTIIEADKEADNE